MKTPQEAAREYAHDHIAERCKSTNCKEFDCRPFDRNVAGYHTRCRARYQEYRDGFLAGDAFGYRRGLEKAYRWISVEDLMETRWKMLQQSKYFNRGVYWAVFIGWVIGIVCGIMLK